MASSIVDGIYRVHKGLGPGLLESVYEACLAYELRKSGLMVQTQLDLPVRYDDVIIEAGFRIDVLVNETLPLELKAVEKMNPLYEAQMLTYLKLTGFRLGLLVNFNVPLIKDGIRRIIL